MFAEELLRMSSYSYMREEYKDYVIAACLVHDTIKYGMGEEINKDEYRNHARNAADAFKKGVYKRRKVSARIKSASTHQTGKNPWQCNN